MNKSDIRIGVIGMGYVGLPVALAFAKKYQVTGYDIDASHISKLNKGIDPSREMAKEDFSGKTIVFSSEEESLSNCNIYIVAVPTPVDEHKVPVLEPLKESSNSISKFLKKGDYVIYESTVYPGCTEEICQPILEKGSSMVCGEDFKIGYSPERINPGDKTRPFEKILKIVSGCDAESLSFISWLYNDIIEAGVFEARSIKVAEACKITENTQRDVNIALMNELAIIFDRMGINTMDVLKAAHTKWNFLDFYPGLVGGHCIDIDPYYLAFKAQELGYTPDVILSGRKVNSAVPSFISKKIVQNLLSLGKQLKTCRVLIKGLSFKENVSDVRNSRVFDLVNELEAYHIQHELEDYLVDAQDVQGTNVNLITKPNGKYDALILAVAHDKYKEERLTEWQEYLSSHPVIFDVKSTHFHLRDVPGLVYLSL